MNPKITVSGENSMQFVIGGIIYKDKIADFEITWERSKGYVLHIIELSADDETRWFFPEQKEIWTWQDRFKIIKWFGENVERLFKEIETSRKRYGKKKSQIHC